MGTFPFPFDPSRTKVRLGLQPCLGAQPEAADLTYFPGTSGAATSQTIIAIEDPTFQVGQAALPVAGPAEVAGDMTFSTAADATVPLEAAGLVAASTVTDLGGGAFSVLLGPSQAISTGLAFMEIDNSDPSPQAFYDIAPVTMTWAVDSGGLFTLTVSPGSTNASRWDLGVEWYPTPATGRLLQLRGTASQNFERSTEVLDASAVDLYFRVIDNSTSIPVFVAVVGRPGPITGTVEMSASTELVGTGTLFRSEIYRGDLLDVEGNLLIVEAVASDVSATMSASATVTAGTTAIREFGTAQSIAQPSMGFPLSVGLDAESLAQYGTVNDSVTGAKMGKPADVGHPVEAWFFSDAGIPTPTASALTSTYTVSAGSKAIVSGAGALLSETQIGGLFTTVGGQVRRIASITDDDNAVADRNFDAAEGPVAATFTPPPTFALSGTWEASASATLSGSGGDALAQIGSGTDGAGVFIRAQDGANQGVIARVVSVADDDTIVVHRVVTIAAATTLETDFTFQVPRLRSTWTPTALASGPQPSTQCKVFFEIDALDAQGNNLIETIQKQATSFSLPYTTGYTASVVPLGSAYPARVSKTTVSLGQLTVVIEKSGKTVADLIEAQARVRVKLAVTSGKQIGTSAFEYSKNLVIHGKFAGTPLQAPSADEINETVLIDIAVPATADPDFPDSVQEEIFTDRIDPLFVTALL